MPFVSRYKSTYCKEAYATFIYVSEFLLFVTHGLNM